MVEDRILDVLFLTSSTTPLYLFCIRPLLHLAISHSKPRAHDIIFASVWSPLDRDYNFTLLFFLRRPTIRLTLQYPSSHASTPWTIRILFAFDHFLFCMSFLSSLIVVFLSRMSHPSVSLSHHHTHHINVLLFSPPCIRRPCSFLCGRRRICIVSLTQPFYADSSCASCGLG